MVITPTTIHESSKQIIHKHKLIKPKYHTCIWKAVIIHEERAKGIYIQILQLNMQILYIELKQKVEHK